MRSVVTVFLVTLCFGITYAGNIDYLTNRSVLRSLERRCPGDRGWVGCQ